MVVVDNINKAPAYAFFGDDKKSLKKELDKILEKTIVLLEDVSINEYRAKIEEYTNKISMARRSHAIIKTKDKYDLDIADEKNIALIKIHFRERLTHSELKPFGAFPETI